MKRRWLAMWAVIVAALAGIWLGIVYGVIGIDPLTNFYFVIAAVAVIGILSIIGAVFVGIFVVYRIYYRQEFTPFEKEMLAMREEMKTITAKVTEIREHLGSNPGKKG